MVRPGMRRYRVRTEAQAALIGDADSPLDLAALFGPGDAPVRLEIGFGHGEFIAAMAAAHPHERFIGVDYDPLRATKTAHKSLRVAAANVRLFTDEAHRFVRFRVPPASLSRCYILFPDPWPKPGHRRRRLLNRSFLIDVTRLMRPGGRLVIASDTHNYALQALTNLSAIPDAPGPVAGAEPRAIAASAPCWRDCYAPEGYRLDIPTRFPTTFEKHKKAEGHAICYLLLERTQAPAPDAVPWRAPARPGADADAD